MLEQLIYKNHLNEVFNFGVNGIYVNCSELHDYEWKVEKRNEKIASFGYAVTKRKLPVIIMCATEEEGVTARNNLFEIVEKDVLAQQYGRIILNGYYFKCFVTKSVKKKYLTSKRQMEITLTLTTDYPYWVKENSVVFRQHASNGSSSGIDYEHDYPHDFFANTQKQSVFNPHFMPSNFRLVIHGSCVDPSISISGHIYRVDCNIQSGEYLTIDSTEKQIYLTGTTGTVTNLFASRNRDSYIFEKIPVGSNDVAWEGIDSFELILMEERSEPKWI